MACVEISVDLSFISVIYTLNHGFRACFVLPFSPFTPYFTFFEEEKQNGRGKVSLQRPLGI